MDNRKSIVVIGAGVVGLTTAVKMQESGYRVTIVAETLPTDPKTIRYTSQWGGAQHVSGATDKRQLEIDKETFRVMWNLSAPGGGAEGCFLRIKQTECYGKKITRPSPLEFMPDFRYLSEGECYPGTIDGVTFTTVTVDTPVYLNYLFSRFLASGGSVVRGIVQHINQVIEGGADIFQEPRNARHSRVDAVVVCVGLGARTLGGVEDSTVYPIRGQTVLLRAPWIRFGGSAIGSDGLSSYTVPRRSGDVIIGGTKVPDDWYPRPRPDTTIDILRRVLKWCPELAPPEVRADRKPTVEDLLSITIEAGCGLRPARKEGIRLEVEWFEHEPSQRKLPVVYNYGHGGAGFQSSWGSALMALQHLEEALKEHKVGGPSDPSDEKSHL